jgi:hypothetical protein
MAKSIPAHVEGLLQYLSRPQEAANEDRAITYFRTIYGDAFTKDTGRSDGHVAGLFVLELKGKTNAWLSGLFQGLAYKRELDFSQVIVAAKDFLGVWRVSDLPEEIRHAVLSSTGAASSLGTKFATRYRSKRNALLKLATWHGDELSGSLFHSNPEIVLEKIASFEKTIREGEKVRQKVTLKNFTAVLKEMKSYFDPKQPVKAVRAFYSMVYGWNEASTLQLSDKVNQQATLAGETITDLSSRRSGSSSKSTSRIDGYTLLRVKIGTTSSLDMTKRWMQSTKTFARSTESSSRIANFQSS